MSAITKLFIVLQVVCSLFLTAGVVVFVNRVEDYKGRIAAEQDKTKRAEGAVEVERAAQQAAVAENLRLAAYNGAVIDSLNKTIADRSGTIATLRGSITDLQKQIDSKDTQLASAIQQATAGQEMQKAMQTEITALRNEAQDLRVKQKDADVALVKAVKERDTLLYTVSRYQEQLEALQRENTKQARLLMDSGINIAATPGTPKGAGTPAIGGVVRRVERLQGITYATISVGAADRVEKGMQFKVIDPGTGDFMGMFTVESVDPNESFGRLEGQPEKVAGIRQDMQVKTQL